MDSLDIEPVSEEVDTRSDGTAFGTSFLEGFLACVSLIWSRATYSIIRHKIERYKAVAFGFWSIKRYVALKMDSILMMTWLHTYSKKYIFS